MKTIIQETIESLLQPYIYTKYGYKMFNMNGTRSDYKVEMIYKNVTPSGNVNVIIPNSFGPDGIGDFEKRRAMLRYDMNGSPYLFIEDGTGSLVLRL